MTADSIRDRWLRSLAESLSNGNPLPGFSEKQVDDILRYLDDHPTLGGTEVESVIRGSLAPIWIRGGPTLREARRELRSELDSGTRCPCCGKWAKRYKRRLNGAVVRSLAWLVLASDDESRSDPEGWVDVPKYGPRWMMRGNPHPKLALWGFAERRPVDEDAPTRSSGVWRPTPKGRRFVAGQIHAPAFVYEYLSEVESVSEERVAFRDVLDVPFDYPSLMAGPSR